MTAEEINALPERVRRYIHDLETSWGNEAHIIQENFKLREDVQRYQTIFEMLQCRPCACQWLDDRLSVQL